MLQANYMRKSVLIPLIAAAVLASGCVYRQPIYQGNLMEAEAVQQLQVGMNKEQVLNLLGTPSIADPFNTNRWDYTSSQRIGRVRKAEVHTFTVYFENEAVTRWEGDYFPEQDAELAKNARKQFGPNLAKEKKKPGRG